MVYNDSTATQQQMDAFYKASWYASTRPYRLDSDRLIRVASYLAEHVPLDARTLEVGTGDGLLLRLLKEQGFDDCSGWNLGDDKPIGQFDLIIVNHVLEHVVNVREFVDNLRDLLAPEGMLYVEVPDASQYLAYTQESFTYFNFEHVNHFTMRQLITLLGMPVDHGERIFETVPGNAYPAIYGLWRFSLPTMRGYIERSFQDEQALVGRILNQLNGRRKVYVRGFSHRAWHILALPELAHLEVEAFIDLAPYAQRLTLRSRPLLAADDPIDDYPVILLADSAFITEQMAKTYAGKNEVIY